MCRCKEMIQALLTIAIGNAAFNMFLMRLLLLKPQLYLANYIARESIFALILLNHFTKIYSFDVFTRTCSSFRTWLPWGSFAREMSEMPHVCHITLTETHHIFRYIQAG